MLPRDLFNFTIIYDNSQVVSINFFISSIDPERRWRRLYAQFQYGYMTNVKDDEKEFSKQFVDECDREIMKFLQEMEKKHRGFDIPIIIPL